MAPATQPLDMIPIHDQNLHAIPLDGREVGQVVPKAILP